MKNILLIVSCFCLITTFMSCEDYQATSFEQVNQGFLTYSSGFGQTEGVKISSYGDDEGYILLGNTDSGNDENYFLVKTDIKGNIIWAKSYGDLRVDNDAQDLLVEDNLIYILGDQYQDSLERIIPFATAFDLESGQRISDFNINLADSIDNLLIYEEKSAGFLLFNDIKKKVIASTALNIDGFNTGNVYLIDEGNGIEMVIKVDIDDPNTKFNLDINGIKRVGTTNSFLLVGTASAPSIGYTGFLVVQYKIDEVNGGLVVEGIWDYGPGYETKVEDFLIISADLIMVLNRAGNTLWGDVLQLPQGGQQAQGLESLAFGDNMSLGKSATASTIDENTFIITTVKNNNGLIIEKIALGNDGFTREWGDDIWTEHQSFNNLSNHDQNTQIRNNIGNAVLRRDGGYTIIGTHDFLDVTKMVMMQVDADGYYIEDDIQ
jgi:hypothetical protein